MGRNKNTAIGSNAPSLVYEEGDIIKRTLRDIYDNETKNIYIEAMMPIRKLKSL